MNFGPDPCYEEAWDTSPCVVEMGSYIPYTITCRNIDTPDQLKTIFARLKNPKCFPSLNLHDSMLTSLPVGVFGNFSFESISLRNTLIQKIEPGVIQGMAETLTFLEFKGNQLQTFDFIREAENLLTVIIENEPLEQLPDKAFADVYDNLKVYIFHCPLRTIGDYAFANFSGLVRIQNNTVPIQKFGNYVFRNDIPSDYIVFLTNCSISDNSFSPNTFVGSEMKFLILLNNNLTTLDMTVFSPVVENMYTRVLTDRMDCEKVDWDDYTAFGRKIFPCTCSVSLRRSPDDLCPQLRLLFWYPEVYYRAYY